jgi:2-C-methyl-D-erythritol 2,4-cyclodiphosphate synthase
MRTGLGYDIHRLVAGRKLVLGGVKIDYELGLLGHSDGDVVLHAVIDSLLGACGLGDIGELFPDTDPAYKDADSAKLFAEVLTRVANAGFAIEYVDVIIHAEKPKLKKHKPVIRQRLAELMGVSLDQVNIKAKTNEGLDAVGHGEAIASWAAATVRTK